MSEQANNPYAPPSAIVGDAEMGSEGQLIPGGRSVPAGNGVRWIGAAWEMFKQNPGTWILLMLVFFVLYFVVAIIPIVNFLVMLLMPVIMGGMAIACENQRNTGVVKIGDLFAGFQRNTGSLVLVGVIAMGAVIVIMLVLGTFVGIGTFMTLAAGGDARAMMTGAGLGTLLLVGLLAFVAMMLVYAAIWFAPALVVLHDVKPVEAMKQSFTGSLKNILPGIVYFLVFLVLAIIATIPFGLGWLVLAPIAWIAVYTCYRDIFIEE